jgi:hypothetical protein
MFIFTLGLFIAAWWDTKKHQAYLMVEWEMMKMTAD